MRNQDEWNLGLSCLRRKVQPSFNSCAIDTLPSNAFRSDKRMILQDSIIDSCEFPQVIASTIHIPDIARCKPVDAYHCDHLPIFAKLWTGITPIPTGKLLDGMVFSIQTIEMDLTSLLHGNEKRFAIWIPLWAIDVFRIQFIKHPCLTSKILCFRNGSLWGTITGGCNNPGR